MIVMATVTLPLILMPETVILIIKVISKILIIVINCSSFHPSLPLSLTLRNSTGHPGPTNTSTPGFIIPVDQTCKGNGISQSDDTKRKDDVVK
jgi:hypothetical protein